MPIQRAVDIPIRRPIKKKSMGVFPKLSFFKAKMSKSGDGMEAALPRDSEGIGHGRGVPSLHNGIGVTVQEQGIDSVINWEISTDCNINGRLSSEEITHQRAWHALDHSVGIHQPMDGNVSTISSSTSTLSTNRSFRIPSPQRQSTQDSISTSMSSQSAQSKVNVPPQSPRGSNPTIVPILQIPLVPPNTTTSRTSGNENGVQSEPDPPSGQQVHDLYDADLDLPPRYSFVAGPRRLSPLRSHTSDEGNVEDEVSINEFPPSSSQSDRIDQSDLVRLGKEPATWVTSGITGFFSPWFLGEQGGPSAQPESSTSTSVNPQWPNFWAQSTSNSRAQYSYTGKSNSIGSCSLQEIDEYSFDYQDIEDNNLLAETLLRLEEDRLLAEELQRIEEMDFNLAREWQDEEDEQLCLAEEREEHFRLEELIRIASEDALLAAELARQEQEEYEKEQRLEREETARKEELKRQERERQRQEEARLLRQSRGLGVPIAVRRIGHSGRFGEGNLDEATPEIVDHLKNVKTLFLKHLPGYRITKIEWIINPRLQEQFEDARQKLRNARRSTKEVILFHGTAPANVDS